jgi:hypothetical protein
MIFYSELTFYFVNLRDIIYEMMFNIIGTIKERNLVTCQKFILKNDNWTEVDDVYEGIISVLPRKGICTLLFFYDLDLSIKWIIYRFGVKLIIHFN